jgi:hypothetical protein
VYVITDVPAEIPLTTPDALPIVATPVALLLHVPLGVVFDNADVKPSHIFNKPVMGAIGFVAVTVTLSTVIFGL